MQLLLWLHLSRLQPAQKSHCRKLRISCQFRTHESKPQISRGIFTNFLILFPTFVINQATINPTFHCFFFLKHDTSRRCRIWVLNTGRTDTGKIQIPQEVLRAPKSHKLRHMKMKDAHCTYMGTDYYFQGELIPFFFTLPLCRARKSSRQLATVESM